MQVLASPSLPRENRFSSNGFIPALTGLRAIAAFLVFFSHFPIPTKTLGVFFSQFCSELYIGVSIFFVLSGFLIALRYLDNFTYSVSDFLKYMKKRFARIYPMYFILTSASFIYYKIDPSFARNAFHFETPTASIFTVYLLNITFLRGFFHDIALSGISQGWTLTVEECFYILAPFIFLIRNKIPLVVQVMFWYLIGFSMVHLFKDVNLLGLFQSNKFMLIMTFFGRCLEFYIGIQLALWYKRDKRPLSGGYYTYLGIVFLLLIVGTQVFTKDNKAEYYIGLYSSIGLIINNFILPFAIALIFKGLLRERTHVRAALENKVAILLGRSSYIFYLIHMGLMSELLHTYITHNYLLNFPLLVLLSIVMYKFIEYPLNNIIRKI